MSTSTFVCLYGHFYQPPREDPFTGRIPREPGATPYDNFNEKIYDECYRPNAEQGNFESISFDLGPTLAMWLEQHHPDVHQQIVAADRRNVERYGVGNALAQAFNHTILPLATTRDKRTQIAWGLADFARRFGRAADGMWLAETAVDLETLDLLAERGVRYTVLAPWQSAEAIDPTEPYHVRLPSGREIVVFFYNGPLSGGVSFDWDTTCNADSFAASYLPNHLNGAKLARQEDQLIVVATDGELYGHHKPWCDQFLAHLVREGAKAFGFEVVSLGRYLRDHPPAREVSLRVPSAWSCAHGVARWGQGCACTEGDAAWKPALRRALDTLA
ncbi:MAG: glycoside hydrolase, partial [Ktedonobacterales bacterium]|nr:glycoside hydrolase [Ktedonobacterales bacterium]